MSKTWKQWEGEVVNARFVLGRFLGGHEQSGVFQTEYEGRPAAIKLVLTGREGAASLRSRWERAARISHANLIRLFETGEGDVNETPIAYVVMEYAEEDLAQVLPERPLAPEEARQMLEGAGRALAHLHDEGYVHGHVKPANIMAVQDQLKISSDGICRQQERCLENGQAGRYDPPEAASGVFSPAGDIWSLGATLVEALTQRSFKSDPPPMVESLPAPFDDIAANCLHGDPQRRWTARQVLAKLEGTTPAFHREPMVRSPGARRYIVPAVAIALLLAAVVAGVNVLNRPDSRPEQPVAATPAQPLPAAPPAEPPPQPRVAGKVVREIAPQVSAAARNSIRGRVRVRVRVDVDSSGRVTEAGFDSPGPSRYFAQQALQAARRWEFTPPEVNGKPVSSRWLIRFEFRRSGTEVSASEIE